MRSTDHATRVQLVERHLTGESLTSIADELELNRYTVRKWWRRFRDRGWQALEPRPQGPPPSGPLSNFYPRIKFVALRLKREHPAWGLDLLLLHLRRRASLTGVPLPGRTALYNYLRQFRRLWAHRPPRTKRPKTTVKDVTEVHQCWQIDFKGDVKLNTIGTIKPFVVCEAFTSAPLAIVVHQIGDGHTLMTDQVQEDLRSVFAQWGLPEQIRMDRDPSFIGSTRLEWPGRLLLWLVGLGIEPIINRPHCPTDNARVERQNRVWHEHVFLGPTLAQCPSLRALQVLTDAALQDRRAVLPSRNAQCGGQAPLVAQPSLAVPRRRYSTSREARLFKMERVWAYLGQWQWQRKVDSTGSISMADLNRRVSLAHVGQLVKVHFDVGRREFVALSVEREELRRFTLPVVSADYIMNRGGM